MPQEENWYATQHDDLVILRRVKTRLFDGTQLSFDERRDLAKTLDAVIERIQQQNMGTSEELLSGKQAPW